jgi:hypothetical protein
MSKKRAVRKRRTPKPASKPVAKRGRPKVEIDLDVLESLAHDGCVNAEIAAFFGLTERALEIRFSKEPALREAKLRGVLKGNVSLRRAQMSMALSVHGHGARTMLVWLGKQRLNQTDKHKVESDSTVRSEGPPPIIHVEFVEAQPETEGDSPTEQSALG